MISVKALLSLGAVAAVLGGITVYRWHHPCSTCPISMAIGALGGPAGCAPAPASQAVSADIAASPATVTVVSTNAIPKPTMNPTTPNPAVVPAKTETAMFGAGCFWGVEATFRKIPGVIEATSGYAGGTVPNATYKQVCTDKTGHAEVVQVQFDPTKVSYQTLVEMFFKLHDPTQVNRQGPDFGSQYRSAIFYYSSEQQKVAEQVKQALTAKGKYKQPIATEISKAGEFYKAEEYHQRYLEKNGLDNCHIPQED
jgi:peptide-methionine (S)-S-oxide reductase